MAVHRSERNGVCTSRRCIPAPSCSLPWRSEAPWNCPANLRGGTGTLALRHILASAMSEIPILAATVLIGWDQTSSYNCWREN